MEPRRCSCWQYDASDRLLARDIAVVDLRLPDKMVLRRNAPEPQPEADPKIVTSRPVRPPVRRPGPEPGVRCNSAVRGIVSWPKHAVE